MLKMTSRLTVLAAALAAALAFATGTATASPVPDYPFVHIGGNAFRPVMPDIAALDFVIEAVGADPAAARAVLEARVAEVHALMDRLGIERDDATVREVRQDIRKGEKSADGGPVYELHCEVHINVRNLSNWGLLAGGLFGKPNLSSFASSFDLSTMEQTIDELRTEATLDARKRAEVLAAASGRRLGVVMAMTPDQVKNLGTSMGLEREEFRQPRRNSNARTDLDRDELMTIQMLKLGQRVDVIFRLESPGPARRAK